MVLIPRLEYRSRLTILSELECDLLYKPMRILIKNKLGMRRGTPNSIIHNKLAYGFNDLSSISKPAKIQQFINIINFHPDDTILGLSTLIRLKQLQQRYWLFDNPLVCWPKSLKHYRHKNFLSNFITSYHDSNFSFMNSSKMIDLFRVTGGLVPLQTIMPWN